MKVSFTLYARARAALKIWIIQISPGTVEKTFVFSGFPNSLPVRLLQGEREKIEIKGFSYHCLVVCQRHFVWSRQSGTWYSRVEVSIAFLCLHSGTFPTKRFFHPQPISSLFSAKLLPTRLASSCLVNVKNCWASFRLDEHLIKGL